MFVLIFNFYDIFYCLETGYKLSPNSFAAFFLLLKDMVKSSWECRVNASHWQQRYCEPIPGTTVRACSKYMKNVNKTEKMDYQDQVLPPSPSPEPMEVDGQDSPGIMEWEAQPSPKPGSPLTIRVNPDLATRDSGTSPVNLLGKPQISELPEPVIPNIVRPRPHIIQGGHSGDAITHVNTRMANTLRSNDSAFRTINHSPRVTSPANLSTSSPLPNPSVPEVGNNRSVDTSCDEEVARFF